MIRKKQGSIEWLEFELFSELPGLAHAIFLRGEEDVNSVESGRQAARGALGIQELIYGHQKHGANLLKVPSKDPLLKENCDGMVTDVLGLGLLIQHADCQAAILYDPIHQAVGAVHCGWRGNVQNIYAQAVQLMCETVGSKKGDILVGISPSLGPKHAEFIYFEKEWPRHFWEFQIKPTYFDLWQMSRHQLEEAGILSHHIQVAEICTYESEKDFFSYRRDRVKGRNNSTVVALKSDLHSLEESLFSCMD